MSNWSNVFQYMNLEVCVISLVCCVRGQRAACRVRPALASGLASFHKMLLRDRSSVRPPCLYLASASVSSQRCLFALFVSYFEISITLRPVAPCHTRGPWFAPFRGSGLAASPLRLIRPSSDEGREGVFMIPINYEAILSLLRS